jgi:hypothetical protein
MRLAMMRLVILMQVVGNLSESFLYGFLAAGEVVGWG